MLVIANGAQKSGSTWVKRIVTRAIPHVPPPKAWRRAGWKNRSIPARRIPAWLAEPRPTVVMKAHFKRGDVDRDALLDHGQVVILNISRDIRGAVNSHFHFRALTTGETNLQAYWEAEGRTYVEYLADFHAFWDVDHPRYHRFSYEGLLSDFHGELRAAWPVLEYAGAETDIDTLYAQTQRETVIAESEARGHDARAFYRKGEAEDWRNHLTPEIAQEAVELSGAYAFTP